MPWYQAAFLGLIQGLTEFLPVSSSGHLAFFQIVFNMEDPTKSHLLFTVLLHLGTLLAIFVAFWRDIKGMAVAFFSLFSKGKSRDTNQVSSRRLVLLIIIATLPLLIILPFKDFIDGLYAVPAVIGCALILTGILLFMSDRLRRGSKIEKNATIVDAIAIGIMQAIAVIPGLSRSGFTITGGLLRGFKRDFAVKFSFLMSIPAVLGATVIELIDAFQSEFDASLIPVYLLGVVIAAISGYFAIILVRYIANKGKFGGFACYCALAGAAVIIFSFFR